MVMRRKNSEVPSWEKDLLQRFLTLCAGLTPCPTAGQYRQAHHSTIQWDLLSLLDQELRELGVPQITRCTTTATSWDASPAIRGKAQLPTVLLMAHVDVAEDAPGNGVKPGRSTNIAGGDLIISLGGEVRGGRKSLTWNGIRVRRSSPATGATLLGADDKAGVAEIMTAIQVLMADSQPYPTVLSKSSLPPMKKPGEGWMGLP
jgi:tripeptide aminopeptidase